MGAIIKIPCGNYRKIAQENWGLTDEQMKGMHVHHRIPQSEGGTNDPANLYVCSPSFHFRIWHSANSALALTEKAAAGGTANTEKQHQQRVAWGEEWAIRVRDSGANLRGRLIAIENRKTSIELTRILTSERFYFGSQIEACKKFNLSKGSLHGVLNGTRKQHKGFTARYVKRQNEGRKTKEK